MRSDCQRGKRNTSVVAENLHLILVNPRLPAQCHQLPVMPQTSTLNVRGITPLADGDDEAAAAMTTKAGSTATCSPQHINFAEPAKLSAPRGSAAEEVAVLDAFRLPKGEADVQECCRFRASHL